MKIILFAIITINLSTLSNAGTIYWNPIPIQIIGPLPAEDGLPEGRFIISSSIAKLNGFILGAKAGVLGAAAAGVGAGVGAGAAYALISSNSTNLSSLWNSSGLSNSSSGLGSLSSLLSGTGGSSMGNMSLSSISDAISSSFSSLIGSKNNSSSSSNNGQSSTPICILSRNARSINRNNNFDEYNARYDDTASDIDRESRSDRARKRRRKLNRNNSRNNNRNRDNNRIRVNRRRYKNNRDRYDHNRREQYVMALDYGDGEREETATGAATGTNTATGGGTGTRTVSETLTQTNPPQDGGNVNCIMLQRSIVNDVGFSNRKRSIEIEKKLKRLRKSRGNKRN